MGEGDSKMSRVFFQNLWAKSLSFGRFSAKQKVSFGKNRNITSQDVGFAPVSSNHGGGCWKICQKLSRIILMAPEGLQLINDVTLINVEEIKFA